jgi:hypothetical protein
MRMVLIPVLRILDLQIWIWSKLFVEFGQILAKLKFKNNFWFNKKIGPDPQTQIRSGSKTLDKTMSDAQSLPRQLF